MFDDMRVVVVTPAGRKRYMEILFNYIKKLRPIIDEYRLWVNTENAEDITFMQNFQKENSDFVTLEYLPVGTRVNGNSTIFNFFKNCKDINTIYVRFDDDIVVVDNIEQFKKFLMFRKNNPEYFLVYANIINNAICTHIHQRNGNIGFNNGISGYECIDRIGWKDENFAKYIHLHVLNNLKGDISLFRMKNWILYYFERVSINVISWMGSEFNKFNGVIDPDEEGFLSVKKPKSIGKMNVIFGDFVCSHYAFYTQRSAVDNDASILSGYKELSL